MKDILTKEDFQFNKEYRYWSYKTGIGFEITLEPCFNGFDVAIYREGDIGPIRDKECTDEEGYGSEEWMKREITLGIQERRPDTWKHGLEIANKYLRSLKNYITINKMGLVDRCEGEIDPMLAELEQDDWKKPQKKIHGICPKGRI